MKGDVVAKSQSQSDSHQVRSVACVVAFYANLVVAMTSFTWTLRPRVCWNLGEPTLMTPSTSKPGFVGAARDAGHHFERLPPRPLTAHIGLPYPLSALSFASPMPNAAGDPQRPPHRLEPFD